MLTSDLEGGDDKDKSALDVLLGNLLRQLTEVTEDSGQLGAEDRVTTTTQTSGAIQGLWCRSVQHEVSWAFNLSGWNCYDNKFYFLVTL